MYLHYVDLDESVVDLFKGIIDVMIMNKEPDDSKNLSTSGRGKQYDLFYDFKLKENLISSYIKDMVCQTMSVDDLTLDACWTVLGKKGSYHICHRHTTSHGHNTDKDIAIVLYLETPEENGYEGLFYFVMDNEVHEVVPKKGRLLIFPVKMYHGTYPQSDGLRQTLNMDFFVNGTNSTN